MIKRVRAKEIKRERWNDQRERERRRREKEIDRWRDNERDQRDIIERSERKSAGEREGEPRPP